MGGEQTLGNGVTVVFIAGLRQPLDELDCKRPHDVFKWDQSIGELARGHAEEPPPDERNTM